MDYIRGNDELAVKMVSYYGKSFDKQAARPDYLPDKSEVTEIIYLLRRLLFPGYFDKDERTAGTEQEVHALISETEVKLRRQVCRALNLNVDKDGECSVMLHKAGEICRVFFNRLPNLMELLLSDVQAAYEGDPAANNEHEIIFAYPGIFAVSVYRLAHELHLLSVPLIPRIMTEYAHSLTGIDIHPGADIGHHFFIDHGTGVVIGETTKIGAYVKLYQGVTLGALSTRGGQNLRGTKRHPTLEDEVTVYSGASILGGETVIGKGSVIGGNAFITQPIPPYTKVYLKNHELEYGALKRG